ncbi:MAG: heavy metal translocating P-type ATPase [Planctomycetota bacterium]
MTTLPARPAANQRTKTEVACTHCSLPVPAGLIEHSASEQFCCGACKIAYAAISECGLDAYYELRKRLEVDSAPASASGARFAEFDDPVFAERHVREMPDGLRTCELYLEGVHCAACVWLVERLPRVVAGVIAARLDLGRSLITLVWDPNHVELSAVARGIDRLGYRPHPATQHHARESRKQADRAALVRIGVAGACMGNVMLLAAALYSGMLDGIEDSTRHAFRLLSAAIGLVAIFWPGRVFFQGAMAALRARTWHLDMPIAIALGAGTVTGVFFAIRGTGEIYFDSVTMLVFLLLFGRWLQERGMRAAADSIDLRNALTPTTTHRVEADGTCRDVPTDAIEAGDTVEVRVGETCPVDGVVVKGTSHVDQAVLTGEPRPIAVAEGDAVPAGAVNTSSVLRVKAEAVGANTRIGRVLESIARLSRERLPVIGRAERVAKPFVITVTSLATLCMLIWLHKGWELALDHTTALLIVACPCALALATPLVTAVAIGDAAKRGRLIKGADVFDRMRLCNRVFLDKTGTVTRGRFAVQSIAGDEAIIPLAAAIERETPHPIASAIAELNADLTASETTVAIGKGVEGFVDDVRVAVGQQAFVESVTGASCEHLTGEAVAATELGNTVVFAADSTGRACVIALGDEIRNDARSLIANLHARGKRVSILSGDDPTTVRLIAAQLGLDEADALGGMSPDEKLATIESALEEGPVAMAGDGVNDAAALAKATCGIAVHGGAEASLAAADVYITADDLDQIVQLADSSGKVVSAVKKCLMVSLSYNVAASSMALAGLMSPLIAAFLMPTSSLTVVLMALGLGRAASKNAGGERP